MNNKGFTLVELLAVIIILSLLITIISVAVTKLVKDTKSDLSDSQLKLIESAAKAWGAENIKLLPKEGSCGYLKLKNLKNYGLLDSSITDPKTGNEIPNSLIIKISTESNSFGNPIINYEINPERTDECEYIFFECTIADKDNIKIGDEVGCGTERFYVVGINNVTDEVALLAKYNLFVGKTITGISDGAPVYGDPISATDPKYGIQSSDASISSSILYESQSISFPFYPGTYFAELETENSNAYWITNGKTYPTDSNGYKYIYDENSNVYQYVEYYKEYMQSHGINVSNARIPILDDFTTLGCTVSSNSADCASAPSWLLSMDYWVGNSKQAHDMTAVLFNALFVKEVNANGSSGVRPVIVINKSEFD